MQVDKHAANSEQVFPVETSMCGMGGGWRLALCAISYYLSPSLSLSLSLSLPQDKKSAELVATPLLFSAFQLELLQQGIKQQVPHYCICSASVYLHIFMS